MAYNLLLYGATGYTGRLIAAEGKALGLSGPQAGGEYRMILAARNGSELRKVAEQNGMAFRVFGLSTPAEVRKGLDGIDVVINAAGPFACTAEPLANAALDVGCHYVDINGEADVYIKLDEELGSKAAQRGIAIVSGAGNTAAASDVLLDSALQRLLSDNIVKKQSDLGAVRIAVSNITDFSRGSAQTVVRSLREEVFVVRKGRMGGPAIDQLMIGHEPIGKLERMFDFGRLPGDRDEPKERVPRIASAASLIDTLTARLTVHRHDLFVHGIESYVQMGAAGRIAYQLGGMLAPLGALPWVRALTEAQLSLLPDGPTQQELRAERHVIVLDIEDVYRTRLIDWRWETPSVYQFTAQLVLAVARSVARGGKRGWVTPADALGLQVRDLDLDHASGPLRDCKLQRRTG